MSKITNSNEDREYNEVAASEFIGSNQSKFGNIEKTHRVHRADNSIEELFGQVNRTSKFFKRIVIAVPSYAMVDAVYELLEFNYGKSNDDVSFLRFITGGYLRQKHFDIKYEYGENMAPWERTASIGQVERERIEATDLWIDELEDTLSKTIFQDSGARPIQVGIVLVKALNSKDRIAELQQANAQIIMFNPGMNDFQNYHHAYEKKGDKWVPKPKQRPEEHHLPSICRNLRVNYIVESDFVATLMKTSYLSNEYDIETKHSVLDHQRSHRVTQIVSDITFKKHSGLFPLIFEHINETHWNGEGKCVGDGMSSPYSFNRLACSTESLSGPIMVKIGQPHPNLLRSLEMQLDGNIQNVKKALVQDHAQTVLRRVNPGESIYFVCDDSIASWLREIPALESLEPINVDVGGRYLRKKIIERDSVVAPLFNDRIKFASTLSKSKSAFTRYVKQYEVEGTALEKMIVNLLLAVTVAVRDGNADDVAQRDFEFTQSLAPSVDNGDSQSVCSKLFKLCAFIINRYVKSNNAQSLVYKRYIQELRNLLNRKKKSDKSGDNQ